MTLDETMIRKNESEGIKEPIDLERNLITIPIDTERYAIKVPNKSLYITPEGDCVYV